MKFSNFPSCTIRWQWQNPQSLSCQPNNSQSSFNFHRINIDFPLEENARIFAICTFVSTSYDRSKRESCFRQVHLCISWSCFYDTLRLTERHLVRILGISSCISTIPLSHKRIDIRAIYLLNVQIILFKFSVLQFILYWQLNDCGFCRYHLMTKSAIT